MALFLVVGGALFWVTIAAWGMMAGPDGLPWARANTLSLLRVAAFVAAASGVAWLVGSIAYATGGLASLADPDMLGIFFFQTPFGPIAIARLGLLAALVLVAASPLAPRQHLGLLVAVGAMLLVSQAWIGHAAEGGDTVCGAAMIVSYAVHVLAGAAWLGALVPLAFAIVELRRRGNRSAAILQLLSRTSMSATAAVAVILGSGVANTAFHAGPVLGHLPASTYGTVLLAKLGLVTLMLSFAGFNRFVAMPRLRRAAPDHHSLSTALGRSVALEAAVGALALGAAAVLGIMPPPY